MKKLLIAAFLPIFFAGCYGNSPGTVQEKSFAQQYAELESEGAARPTDGAHAAALQTAADREADVSAAAQKERRAQPPLVESNYFFQVMPDKGVYSYDEYNQVWSDAPKEKDYKAAKRLWTKPARHKGEYDGAVETAAAPAASQTEVASGEEGDWMEE